MLGGQAVSSAHGRTGWVQTSDWNQLFVPTGLDPAEDVVAMAVDVFVPTGSNFSVGSMNESAAYNDIIKGFNVSLDDPGNVAVATAFAPVNNNGICCSSPMVEFRRQSTPVPLLNGWRTVRVEHRKSTGAVRAYVDGIEVLRGTGSITWGGRYVRLDSGSNAWNASNVAWTNLRIERGSNTCLR